MTKITDNQTGNPAVADALEPPATEHLRNPKTDECINCGADLQDSGPCPECQYTGEPGEPMFNVLASLDCGCQAIQYADYDTALRHCPMHAAAKAMLDALMDVFRANLCPEPRTLKAWKQHNDLIDRVTRAAIAKAEGR